MVVVMMENRSYDHLLGWVPNSDGRQAGLTYTDRDGVARPTWHLAPDYQGCGFADPDHSYAGGRVEWNNGACDGWLRAGQNDLFSIGYYTQADLPFLAAAAANWTICDNYFSSIMAGTFPNRVYQHAAQTDRLSNSITLSELPTIWDRLAEKDLKGRYYFSDIPMLAIWGLKYAPIMRPVSNFFEDAAAGNLPEVSFVEPRFLGEAQGVSGDYHPFGDVRNGEAFMARVYNAVISSPNWANTVLVFNFDEWGGFFDHVAPPTASVPEADRAAGDTSGLMGFRIPAVIVSPWSPRGTVAHQRFDHCSVLKMIEWRWELAPLTVRDAEAANLAEALDFANPNTQAAPINAPEVPVVPCLIQEPLLSVVDGTRDMIVNWVADARLQVALDISGPWTDTTNTVNGFTFTPTESSQFFRIYNKFDRLAELARSVGITLP